jgi:hypothetical protein
MFQGKRIFRNAQHAIEKFLSPKEKKHLTSSTKCGKINTKQGKENPTNQKGHHYEESYHEDPC